MEYAAAIKARLVVIVGPREIKEKKVRLRDMKTGQERNVEMNRLVHDVNTESASRSLTDGLSD